MYYLGMKTVTILLAPFAFVACASTNHAVPPVTEHELTCIPSSFREGIFLCEERAVVKPVRPFESVGR